MSKASEQMWDFLADWFESRAKLPKWAFYSHLCDLNMPAECTCEQVPCEETGECQCDEAARVASGHYREGWWDS